MKSALSYNQINQSYLERISFRYYSLKADHQVEIILMNEGSELDTIPDSKNFDISKMVDE